MMTHSLIGLGGNVGDVERTFDTALAELERAGAVILAVSRRCGSRPMGAAAGGDFLNAAAAVDWPGSSMELLLAMHEIEHRLGRVRTVRWGPRTLDLDLLLFGSEIRESPELKVPHPAMWFRRFVVEPAAEIAANWQHPVLRESLAEMRAKLALRPVRLLWTCDENMPKNTAAGIVEQISGDDPRIEWLPVSEAELRSASPEGTDVCPRHSADAPFAIVEFGAYASEAGSGRRDSWPRKIAVRTGSTAEIAGQLRDLVRAILG